MNQFLQYPVSEICELLVYVQTKNCPDCGMGVHVRKLACTCGHTFSRNRPVLTIITCSKKHEISNLRAQESVERAACRKQRDKDCKAQKIANDNYSCLALRVST